MPHGSSYQNKIFSTQISLELLIFCALTTPAFFNHSDTPNTESREVDREDEVITVAKRDIQPGEELTDDYRTFEAHFVDL